MSGPGLVAAPLAGVLTWVLLSGCASPTERYCEALSDSREELVRLTEEASNLDDDALGRIVELFRELRSEAPDDIVDEWSTVIFAFESLGSALEDAGVSAGEFEPGGSTAGLSAEEREVIEDAATELRSRRVTGAGEGLEQHARDVCQVDLTL